MMFIRCATSLKTLNTNKPLSVNKPAYCNHLNQLLIMLRQLLTHDNKLNNNMKSKERFSYTNSKSTEVLS